MLWIQNRQNFKVRTVLRLSVFLKGQQSDWVEEFVDITDADVEATFQSQQRQFWQQLEDEWRDMAQQNKETGEHPWLDDFEEVRRLSFIERKPSASPKI